MGTNKDKTPILRNYWCELCDHRWKEERAKHCPMCGELVEIHQTMSRDEWNNMV